MHCRCRAATSQPAQQEIQFTIDGREVRATEGAMLVDAAKQGDVEIPYFCYEPKLGNPVGACRMCLVEIEGIPKLQTSCSTPVKDGMVVHTQTDRVRDAQNAVVEFLLVNHPLDCPVCDKGGECPLQDITFGWGRGRSRFIEPKRHFVKPLSLSPLVAIDRERCILCYRCVRFSQEVAEDYQLIFAERGAHTFVATFDGHPYVAPFSGNIIELCPVGALTSKPYRFRARPWDIEGAGGICTLCPSQCNVTFTVRDEKVMRVLARDNVEVDDGWLCDKGRFAYQAMHVDERITAPLVRDGGELREVSWERALEVAAGLGRHRGRVGALVGGQATNEEGFLLADLMRERPGLRGHRLPDRGPGAARDRPRAGRSGAAGHGPRHRVRPHRGRARLRAARRRADPRSARPQGRAAPRREAHRRDRAPERTRRERRSRHSATRPGTRPRSWPTSSPRWPVAAAARASSTRWPRSCSRVARTWSSCWGERVVADALPGLLRICDRLGLASRPGAGLLEIPAGSNGRGLREAGALPGTGPGYAEVLGGRPAAEIAAAAAAGELTALYLLQTDPVRELPDRAGWEAALGRAALVVAHASVLTEGIREHASVVFPAESHAEKEGTVVHPDGRIQRLRSAIAHPHQVRGGWSVIADVARRTGYDQQVLTSAMAWQRLAEAVPFYAGLTLEEIGGRGVRWPAREQAESLPGGTVPSGPPATVARAHAPANGALRMGTYRSIWASPEVEISPALKFTVAHQQVELSPPDARRLGIEHGETVEVAQNGHRLRGTAAVRSGVPEGTAFLADGIASDSANELTEPVAEVRKP